MLIKDLSNQSKSTIGIIHHEECIEDHKVILYGLEQLYVDENGKEIITRVTSISDEKSVVEELLNRLVNEDVYPSSLIYIVEDYIVEISEL